MKDAQPKAIALKDYSVPSYWIRNTELHFALNEDSTTVTNTMSLQRNKAQANAVLNLDGVDIELLEVKLNGQVIGANHYQLEHEKLIFANLPDSCELTIVNKIYPQNNTSLEGLYRSKTMYCTQCEAEGFRKITYYQDRPDVMSKFTTTISADKAQYPILLSNGNAIKRSEQGGRHSVTWQDPFNKPAYLFALVAGDLEHIEDGFTTASGRDVVLQIYTETANINKVDWAMASLKESMRWDEKVYGREYDLDIFMIVAVDDFNMGAMENKGLNIFNSSCVLAQAQTTTDAAFQRVEAVVAHEYFHNWSGNRVTCRDWFQLSLKEGFTVFRDQSFSADMGSPTVCRINDVAVLRTAQFAEDAGPMAHPIRPESYIEISNFYTPTIYEKGAEVVGMIHTILGPQGFREGSDLYFQRHDGEAATCEDFVCAMEAANGVELTQFRRWYEQAGTPIVDVTTQYDAGNKQYHIELTQHNPDTPGQKDKTPLHIPMRLGLLGDDGQDLVLENPAGEVLGRNPVLAFTQAKQSFIFANIGSEPTPSLLRGFSAPVKLNYDYSRTQLSFLMSSDSDGFNRWEAATRLGVSVLQEMIAQLQQGEAATVDSLLVDAYRNLISQSANVDKAMIASMLELPSEAYLRQLTEQVDPELMFRARQQARQQIAQQLKQELLQCYQNNLSNQSYQPSAEQIAQRALQNQCLSYLNCLADDEYVALAQQQFDSANNMTEVSSALRCLVNAPGAQQTAQLALDKFYQQWRDTPLVVDLWLTIQACSTAPGTLARVQQLMQHPAFEFKNPNKVRALIAAFCMQNSAQFHAADGSGYSFLAEQIIALDKLNPQIAARLLNPLSRWQKFDKSRQGLMKAQLQNILDAPGLSKDAYEIASKSL